VRHPQYDGFLLVMIGFLLQWPTIPTLVMFPVLVIIYARLARSEEREVAQRFGTQWTEYASHTPAFLPRLRHVDRAGYRRPSPTGSRPG
jgi:protein-S-isoprenylcysteine O-methyltransferase Ste14